MHTEVLAFGRLYPDASVCRKVFLHWLKWCNFIPWICITSLDLHTLNILASLDTTSMAIMFILLIAFLNLICKLLWLFVSVYQENQSAVFCCCCALLWFWYRVNTSFSQLVLQFSYLSVSWSNLKSVSVTYSWVWLVEGGKEYGLGVLLWHPYCLCLIACYRSV